ncbi:MAG: alanine racemase, partial [Lachnospiraceae bacterium]|nr:alanine racemase [Lachnospiraceae bacterium]
MDMVRAGITLYGLWPSEEVSRDSISLHPLLSLKSRLVCVKEVEKGAQISYGGTYTAKKKMRVATVPVGYGDGYPRGLSGKGCVLICGKRAPILGRVCMDQFMVSVEDIPEAAEGTEVTLIGKDGEERITMEELGALSGRFNYEFACGLGKRIPRVYVRNGRITDSKDYYQDYR